MGYYVEIINTDKVLDINKILYSSEKVTAILQDFNFLKKQTKQNMICFYHSKFDEFVLFYDRKNSRLWANTTSDALITMMIEIAQSFNDGSRVRGDEFETYLSIDKTFIHNDDKPNIINSHKQNYNKIGLFILFMFFIIQFFI